jgi:hypothetical protein
MCCRTEDGGQCYGQLGHAGSLTGVSDGFLDEGNVNEGGIRVDELEGEELSDEGVFVLCVSPMVLVIRQVHGQLLIHQVKNLHTVKPSHRATTIRAGSLHLNLNGIRQRGCDRSVVIGGFVAGHLHHVELHIEDDSNTGNHQQHHARHHILRKFDTLVALLL